MALYEAISYVAIGRGEVELASGASQPSVPLEGCRLGLLHERSLAFPRPV